MTPKNPFRTALLAVGVVSLVLALILLLSGTAIANSETASPDATGVAAGSLALSGFLVAPGILALLLWLVVSALTWQAPTPAKPAAKPRARSQAPEPRNELERVRAALNDEDSN